MLCTLLWHTAGHLWSVLHTQVCCMSQDGQEFQKLLLSLLEKRFGQSQQPHLRTIIADLYRGQCAFETTCTVRTAYSILYSQLRAAVPASSHWSTQDFTFERDISM